MELAYALGTSPGAGGGGGLAAFVPLILMFAVFYFLLIRPQQKKQKQHREMIANIKRGDRVITNGGIYGTVAGLSEHTIILKIADQVKIEITRNAVAGVVAQSTGDES